ncbi:ScbA/BarX family gamma-butyrolactone biosynthesis protein [Streptomyces sp. NPDC058954]|uniref:ScbA/BarX family gamma-butyrolactone biosynthesis protein n=1 Tax=Streptomyces sp. NPDC058954 TaxID=3346677 RepID=UPI0036AD9F9E
MSVLTVHEPEHHTDRSEGCLPGTQLDALPRLTTTVPREYVHRASIAEVFLTSCTRIDETRFTLTGQWPRAHTYFNSPNDRWHDPLQVGETIRQAGLCLAHAELGVLLGQHFVMWDLSWATVPEQLTIGATPSDFIVDATITTEGRRNAVTVRRRLEVTIRRDGRTAATGKASFTCLTPETYRRLRGDALSVPPRPEPEEPPVRMDPSEVGRTHPVDVVLAPTDRPLSWLLAPDTRHPVMFDHGGDHIPGMVLLEAVRQASCAALGPAGTLIPVQASTEFHRYVEFADPCRIEATPLPEREDGLTGFLVTGRQDGKTVFTSSVCGPVARY